MKKITFLMFMLFSLSSCSSIKSASSSTINPAAITPSIHDPVLWTKSANATWHALQHTPLPTLQEAAAANPDPNAKGWLTLAILSKKYSTHSSQLLAELQTWRNTYPLHAANQLFPSNDALNQLAAQTPPGHIAILLPLHGPMAASGQIVRSGFLSAYYDNMGQSAEKQVISFYDTHETSDLGALYQKAVDTGADLIIGPLTKAEVETLHHFNRFDVPVLALNYSTPSFFSALPNNFYEFGLSPTAETEQMSDKARQASLSQALVIAPNDAWGQRVTSALSARFKQNGGAIVDTLYFAQQSSLARDIAALLHINPKEDQALAREDNTQAVLAEQRRQDFDVIFLFAQPEMARQIVPLLRFYYTGNIPIYSISAIYAGLPNPVKDKDLNDVVFCEIPWLIQLAHAPAAGNPPTQYDRLYAIGRDAYLLSQSLPRLTVLAHFPIYGATGALEMDQQRIYQRLPWVKMHNGRI